MVSQEKGVTDFSNRTSMLTTSRTNKDLDPVPRHNRKWGVTSFLAYWISDAFKYGLNHSDVHKIEN
jgi:cytosine/uracil/thiamine/allantoin permease